MDKQNDVMTAGELKGYVDELVAKHEETKSARRKTVNLSGDDEAEYKLAKTQQRSKTVEFFKSLIGDQQYAKEVHAERAKVLSEGTGSAGGFLVPEEFDNEVARTIDDFSQIRRNSRVLSMGSNVLRLNSLITDITVGKVGEGATKPETDPVFGEPVLTLEKYAAITTWTDELMEDSEVNLMSLLSERYAEKIAEAEQQSFVDSAVVGSEGLLTATGTTTVTQATGDTSFNDITFDYLKDMKTALQAVSIMADRNAKYYMHPEIWNIVCQTKAAAGSGTYFGGNPVNGWTMTAWGKEVVLVNEMPALAADAISTKYVIYADLSRTFYIGDRAGLRITTGNEGTVGSQNLFEEDKTALRAVKRTAQVVALPAEVVTLETAAA